MADHIPAHVREQQIENKPNITFVRWDGEYHNRDSKAVCRCTVDGFEWSARVHDLITKGSGCPQCSNHRMWTADERVSQINSCPSVTFVRWLNGVYRNKHSKAVCRCDIAGHEWSASVANLVHRGSGCPQCSDHGYDCTKPATLYALRSECGTMVKIGISNDHERRRRELIYTTPFAWSCVELLHGDGVLIASLEKAFHGMTEPATFAKSFNGHTEWRKWTPEITEWFDMWRKMTQE